MSADAQVSGGLADKRRDGMTAKEAGAAGYSTVAIRAAGYTTEEVAGALKEVMTAGLTASQAHAAGFTHAEMELAGYSPDDLSTTGNGATTAPGVGPGDDDQLSPKAVAKVKRHVTSVQVSRHPTVPPPPDKAATETTAASRNENGGVKRYFSFFPGRGKSPSSKPDAYSRATVDRLKRQNEQQQKELEKQQSEMRLLQEQVAAEPPSPPSHPPLHDCPCCSRRPSAPPPPRPPAPLPPLPPPLSSA